jgi:para-nitrobenzyl esterase
MQLLSSIAMALPHAVKDGPVVHLDSGSVRGYFQGTTSIFKGIPYAAPPVGKLRWREPQPVSPWSGVRDATAPAHACVQNIAGIDSFMKPLATAYGASYAVEPVVSSEDCLYLNVWTPARPQPGALPVMVWLHGGSNTAGSGSQSVYDGASLASHGVIVVTINYRLGVFGFFSHPELTVESPHRSSGNYGLLDQLAALRWVKENIAQFGGNPNNVTLFGESAGALDDGMLMTSPLAAHLFQRVISESGPPFGMGAIQTRKEAESAGAAIGRAASGNPATPLENLRKLSAAELVRIANAQSHGPYAARAIVDGWLLPQAPARAFALGAIQKVDLIVGLNGREMSAFRMAAAEAAKESGQQAKNTSAMQAVKQLADAARPLYSGWTDAAIVKYLALAMVHRELAIDQATNDMLVACPIGAMAALTSATGRNVYVYSFERSIPGQGEIALGAFHSLEVPYVFNAFTDRSWRWLTFAAADRNLSSFIETYWTNFAKTGNPNAANAPGWSAWSQDSESYMQFTQSGSAALQRGFSPSFCHLSVDRLRKRLSENK